MFEHSSGEQPTWVSDMQPVGFHIDMADRETVVDCSDSWQQRSTIAPPAHQTISTPHFLHCVDSKLIFKQKKVINCNCDNPCNWLLTSAYWGLVHPAIALCEMGLVLPSSPDDRIIGLYMMLHDGSAGSASLNGIIRKSGTTVVTGKDAVTADSLWIYCMCWTGYKYCTHTCWD